MTQRDILRLCVLALAGWVLALGVAAFQPAPGYMDADYYQAVGQQLAAGQGFQEPFLWNYLDDPDGLPHPSNAYWMPAASLLAAAGMRFFQFITFSAGRVGFILLAGLLPPLTSLLARQLHGNENLAFYSGLLAVFSGLYVTFLPVTDTFGLYMLLGLLFFLAIRWHSPWAPWALGLLAALMHLTRADGLLWLFIAWAALLLGWTSTPGQSRITSLGAALGGYLLVMLPWFARNLSVFGTPLSPGGYRALLLTHYNQTFAFPASQISWQSFLSSGWQDILSARAWAGGLNLANTLTVQGGIIWLPFILAGLWDLRQDGRIRTSILAWTLTFLAMTLAFPFAGARGGFFHSGAALQGMWWALAPFGLQKSLRQAQARSWLDSRAPRVFGSAFLLLTIGITAYTAYSKLVIQPWGETQLRYLATEAWLDAHQAPDEVALITANPPGYWLASGRPALALPDGDSETAWQVAQKFGAGYLLLEPGSYPSRLHDLYAHPASDTHWHYLTTIHEARLYAISP